MEQNPNLTDNEQAPVTPEPRIPEGMTPEQAAAIAKALAKMKASKKTTGSGSEAVVDTPVAEEPAPEERPLQGKDIDWSEFDIPFELRHHYPRAIFTHTEQGMKWVTGVTEFKSNELDLRNEDKVTQKGMPLNLGQYLTGFLSSNEGWQIAALLPTTNGRVGVLFERKQPMILPDPQRLTKGEELPAPADEELVRMAESADDWASGEGLTTELEPATVPPGQLERIALELNGPAAVDKPTEFETDPLGDAVSAMMDAPEGEVVPGSPLAKLLEQGPENVDEVVDGPVSENQ